MLRLAYSSELGLMKLQLHEVKCTQGGVFSDNKGFTVLRLSSRNASLNTTQNIELQLPDAVACIEYL